MHLPLRAPVWRAPCAWADEVHQQGFNNSIGTPCCAVLQGDGPSWLPTPIQLPVVAREVFSQIVYTSAKDGKGLKDLDKVWLTELMLVWDMFLSSHEGSVFSNCFSCVFSSCFS